MAGAVAAVALLTGSRPEVRPPPASSPPSADLTSVMGIVEAINAGGIECIDGKVFEEVRTQDSESGLCYVGGREFEIDIYVYSSPELRSVNLRGLRRVYEREIVVGSNWYLTTG
ncbi:MAG: hypothetical protein KY391_03875, partial [Actinobacteria bacterium]|nr:hypothetical protein [Actinomycetota bacterium]